MHCGAGSQVPQDYRDWVITKGVWQKRIGLWIALHEAGLVVEDPNSSLVKPEVPQNKQPEADQSDNKQSNSSVDYTFNFGNIRYLEETGRLVDCFI